MSSPTDPATPDPLPSDWRTQLAQSTHAGEPERRTDAHAVSAVLAPILDIDPEPVLLYTRRSEHLSAHPGEISFPGGGLEPSDEGPRHAALRETEEETGIPPDAIELLGHFTDYHTHHDILICAYVGYIDPDATLQQPSTPEEVAERLLVPLSALYNGQGTPQAGAGDTVELNREPLGRLYPVNTYESRRLPRDVHNGGCLHYWRLADATTIWGITGELTARLLASALNWDPPSQPAQLDDLDQIYP